MSFGEIQGMSPDQKEALCLDGVPPPSSVTASSEGTWSQLIISSAQAIQKNYEPLQNMQQLLQVGKFSDGVGKTADVVCNFRKVKQPGALLEFVAKWQVASGRTLQTLSAESRP
jgi:hypothetical protein